MAIKLEFYKVSLFGRLVSCTFLLFPDNVNEDLEINMFYEYVKRKVNVRNELYVQGTDC